MSHVAEGSLQAYLDGELDDAAVAALDRHVAACNACEAELNELRAMNERAQHAFALLDTPPPMVRAQALIGARMEQRRDLRRRMLSAGGFGFAKAAMLLLALAGAGAAVIPGSPLREALENAFARVFGTRPQATQTVEPAPAAPLATPQTQNFGIAPVGGTVRISLRAPAGDVLVRIRTTDEPLADVTTEQVTTVRFRSGPGRAELRDVADATVTISIPRTATAATVDIDDVVYVAKRAGVLEQVREDATSRVRFELGN